jgi:quaternary ammonium compound-resistance protein SugE
MSWVVLICAELFEIAWADGLKYTAGFSRFWPTAGTVVAMVASVVLLGLAVRHVPIGTACAVWTGIGAIGTCCSGLCYSANRHPCIG